MDALFILLLLPPAIMGGFMFSAQDDPTLSGKFNPQQEGWYEIYCHSHSNITKEN
jgi:hypothetical protein